MMIRSSNEFFSQLEQKTCEHCGEVMDEQADCYTSTCCKCDPFQAHESLTKSEAK